MKTRYTAPLQARRGDPKGQVLVLFALMLVVLLLVSALAVDYGGWLVARRGYQNYADAAALAGAHQLTRPLDELCANGDTKNDCAEEAAWESIQEQLNLTTLNPSFQAAQPANVGFVEGDYTIWVASPPAAAGSAYLGRISGPGNVYVRVDHPGATYLSRIAGIGKTITGWATAGRFPANFAVVAMCSPTSVTERCLAGDANIKLDGSGTNLIVETGDLGTNRWVKTGGNSSGLALGDDSNAYMQSYDTCWGLSTNQCQLWGWTDPDPDYTTIRAAVPLGAPIQPLGYIAPTINSTTVPWQCRGTGTIALAAAPASGPALAELPIRLASVVLPKPAEITNAVPTNNDLLGFVKALVGGAGLNGMNVSATNGTNTYTGVTSGGGGNAGRYRQGQFDNVASGTYDITATDPTGTYHTTTVTGAAFISTTSSNTTVTATQINMPKNPVISGTITSASGGAAISGATITITGPGGPFTTTTNGSGFYSQILTTFGTSGSYQVQAAHASYVTGTSSPVSPALDTTTTVNLALTPAPGSLNVNVTDQVTGLAVPNVTVTLTGANSGTATTNSAGLANFSTVNSGSTTITLTHADLTGYVGSSPSALPNPSTVNIASGLNTANFALWPKGCDTGNNDKGNWECDTPSGVSNCPAVTNIDGADVTCTFTQQNAIRPGTYNDITIDNGCAWFDPQGGATGLAAGQSAGMYFIKGELSIGNNSYIFGDGVTIVFAEGADGINVGNGGGLVLNYGTNLDSGTGLCTTVAYDYGDTANTPCFRTISPNDGEDYAYAAWTSLGHTPWNSATFPTYDDASVFKGQEMGITFWLDGEGLGNASRWKLATNSMGYLFNGVLYGPNDDIQMGGGKNGQSAAGQLVGWTIEYHGGTRILQNWYGDPVDGQPFLIEPVLGQ